ncbi:hypothetical protein BDB00DRAFT_851271 [Zychaea mexicana]|uniref:uncharacterized protein n=1 Tax=Zychaea mexicana TaxID=64656 RepID=UPI0022FE94EB|nr:uncharacterized protein BDB00DRAFT_851271 [Zychaea mexicana]KAI9485148.1 hypothetical protein BDB00DRAFT_851271 [Zychaea mexicana]
MRWGVSSPVLIFFFAILFPEVCGASNTLGQLSNQSRQKKPESRFRYVHTKSIIEIFKRLLINHVIAERTLRLDY